VPYKQPHNSPPHRNNTITHISPTSPAQPNYRHQYSITTDMPPARRRIWVEVFPNSSGVGTIKGRRMDPKAAERLLSQPMASQNHRQQYDDNAPLRGQFDIRYNSCNNPFNNKQNPKHDTELNTFGEAGNGEPYIHMACNPPPLRSQHNERSRLSENWIRTRSIIADLLVLRKTEEECTCDMHAARRVRFIGLESYFYHDVEYCSCGVSCVQLAKEGYFPSTPVRPATVFSL